MIFSPSRFVSAAWFALLAATASPAAEPAIIAKARAALGSAAALDGLQTIHFTGHIDGGAGDTATVDILFQKPARQRIAIKSAKQNEITVLDGYDGWTRSEDPKDPTRWQLKILQKDEIKRLRANVWENFGYFRGLERRGGTVEDKGEVTVDGIACQRIAFIHAPNIVFNRCFDRATGRLVLTETESGVTIRESGEIIAGGIRFPKAISNTSKGADGKVSTAAITFDTVSVNEAAADSLFAMPPMKGR